MDVRALVRDCTKVIATLEEKDGVLFTKTGCKVLIPSRYKERRLARIGLDIRTVAIFAIIIEDKYYSVCTYNAMVTMRPDSTNTIMVGEDEYIEMTFDAGGVVLSSTKPLKDDSLAYQIYDEHISKGHIPWQLYYEDVGKLFTSAEKAAGVSLTASNVNLEMIISSIARDPSDRTKFVRHIYKSLDDQVTNPPAFIPFRNIPYGTHSTVAKMLGAYHDDSVMSALLFHNDRLEGYEALLRL